VGKNPFAVQLNNDDDDDDDDKKKTKKKKKNKGDGGYTYILETSVNLCQTIQRNT
jgi:hypothetical protein